MFTNAFGNVSLRVSCSLSGKKESKWYSDWVIVHFMMLETVLGKSLCVVFESKIRTKSPFDEEISRNELNENYYKLDLFSKALTSIIPKCCHHSSKMKI